MTKFSFDSQPAYRILTNEQILAIHEKALFLLENTGVRFNCDEALKILKDNGAKVDFEKKIAKLPANLVLDSIEKAPSAIQLYDREGNPSLLLGGSDSYFAPGSSPLYFLESDGKTARGAIAEDLQKIARVNRALNNIKLQSTSVNLSDVPQAIGDSYRLYILLKNASKPIITGAFSEQGVPYMREMLAAVAGGKEQLREKPFAVFDVCPTPPLQWNHISCQNIIDCARFGLPLETISVPMPGAASPATLAGSLLVHTVETLSGITLAQCVNPGTPVVYGGAPMYFDMRHGTTSLNAAESGMISAAYSQMAKYYGIPCHNYGGLSDAKCIDAQAGLESGMSALLAVQAGINVISGAGAIEFCNTFSLEKLVIDNEICGMALRVAAKINCSEEALAADLISELGPGGSYLGANHTLKWFKKESFIPSEIIDRRTRSSWEEMGAKDAFAAAQEKVRKILEEEKECDLAPERAKVLDETTRKIMAELNISELPLGPQ